MRIAFFGDIVGKSGREAIATHLPILKRKLALDFVIANAENAAAGFGITEKIAQDLFSLGIDCLTLGNHSWDQREALGLVAKDHRVLRPLNYPALSHVPGYGAFAYSLKDGRRILVISLLGRVHMEALEDPFSAVDKALESAKLGDVFDAIVVDIHAEATSEKMAMAHFCDGRASLVVGTHTHVPTADAQILPHGTAYQTDAGACADYDSVIGMNKRISLQRFITRLPAERQTPATGVATLCGLFVETDPGTGLAKTLHPIRIGGRLSPSLPPQVINSALT